MRGHVGSYGVSGHVGGGDLEKEWAGGKGDMRGNFKIYMSLDRWQPRSVLGAVGKHMTGVKAKRSQLTGNEFDDDFL